MVKNQLSIDEFVKHIEFSRKLYDIARIVDPIKNQVLDYSGGHILASNTICYDFWQRGVVCENCISRRALQEKKPFMKIEYNGEKIYMVQAIPLALMEQEVVLELLKDISEERLLFDIVDESRNDIYKLLEERNAFIIKDALTDVYNLRYIKERLPYEIINSHIQDQYISLMILDIDHFRNINKVHGPEYGNHVLKTLAQKVQEKVKEKGWMARYTDDAFILCIEDIDPQGAKEKAQEIRKMIENHPFTYKETTKEITISIGVYTALKPDINADEFIEEAYSLLLQGKKEGGNRVVAKE